MIEALKMGGYGAYVWSSYGLALLALFVMAFAARSASKRELKAALRRVQINSTSRSASSTSDSGAAS